MRRGLFAGIGFAVWLLATVVFRIAGDVLFLHENDFAMLVTYGISGVVVFALVWGVLRWQVIRGAARFEAAALMVLPGMLLDAGVMAIFADVFPNMAVAADGRFGGFLLTAYAAGLLAAFVDAE